MPWPSFTIVQELNAKDCYSPSKNLPWSPWAQCQFFFVPHELVLSWDCMMLASVRIQNVATFASQWYVLAQRHFIIRAAHCVKTSMPLLHYLPLSIRISRIVYAELSCAEWKPWPLFSLTEQHQGLQISGEANSTAAVQVAQLARKNGMYKQLQQRTMAFVGSPEIGEKNLLELIRKNLKMNNVGLVVVYLGEFDDNRPEKLEALVAAASRASGLEFGVNLELVLALPISMEDMGARQAAAKQARDESSKTENAGFPVLVCFLTSCVLACWKPPWQLPALSVEFTDGDLVDVVGADVNENYEHGAEDSILAESTVRNVATPLALSRGSGRLLSNTELNKHMIVHFDPGGSELPHRLGGKPKLKKGGNVRYRSCHGDDIGPWAEWAYWAINSLRIRGAILLQESTGE